MNVLNLGVLITGESGLGKSDLALELISRGQSSLIADDVPDFTLQSDGTILGRCPPVIQDFLEVRGLGLLNIRALFGELAVTSQQSLGLVIRLMTNEQFDADNPDRLKGRHRLCDVLGINIPEVSMPVAPDRRIALLVETVVRNEMLKRQGYNAGDDFIQRQRALMQQHNG